MLKRIEESRYHSPLVRNALDTSMYRGMSERDKFILLAFHALAHWQKVEKLLLQMHRASLVPTFIPSKEVQDDTKGA